MVAYSKLALITLRVKENNVFLEYNFLSWVSTFTVAVDFKKKSSSLLGFRKTRIVKRLAEERNSSFTEESLFSDRTTKEAAPRHSRQARESSSSPAFSARFPYPEIYGWVSFPAASQES